MKYINVKGLKILIYQGTILHNPKILCFVSN